MTFLDEKLFGHINTVASDTQQYPARAKIVFHGVTVTDDPTNNATTVDLSGAGGGGGGGGAPTPAQVVDALAAVVTPVSINGQELQGLATPMSPTSAARKVDVTNLPIHPSVRAFDPGYGLTLSGPQTVDGVACVPGDRVLLGAGYGIHQGIKVVQSGAWTWPEDWAPYREIKNDRVLVGPEGSNYAGYEFYATNTGTAVVGFTVIEFDTLNHNPAQLFGDVSGFDYNNRVQRLRGNAMGQPLQLEVQSVKDTYDTSGYSQTYRCNTSIGPSVTQTVQTHNFVNSSGSITVVAQVNSCSSTGVAESHTISETRFYNSTATPSLIGTSDVKHKPDPATTDAVFIWSPTSVQLQVTSAAGGNVRFACLLQVFECASA